MSKIAYFYLPKGTLNDATIYYTDLIKRAFEEEGYIVKVNTELFLTRDDSFIVAITPASAYRIQKKNPKCKLITWFQGVGPEEYEMLHGKNIRSFLIKKLSEFWEKKALKLSYTCIFVSQTMLSHYENKYNLKISKYVIIPCYNKQFQEDLLLKNNQRYNRLSFVYAGTLYKWQCIDRTLEVFKEIEKLRPEASLTLLTKKGKEAARLCNEYGVKNFCVKYVSLEDLDNELANYKYGFILRENNIVNNVATPTKMNSYLSVGILPIYSDVVDSFRQNIKLGNFQVCVEANRHTREIALDILRQNEVQIDRSELTKCIRNVFDNYYNDSKYISLLRDNLNE